MPAACASAAWYSSRFERSLRARALADACSSCAAAAPFLSCVGASAYTRGFLSTVEGALEMATDYGARPASTCAAGQRASVPPGVPTANCAAPTASDAVEDRASRATMPCEASTVWTSRSTPTW